MDDNNNNFLNTYRDKMEGGEPAKPSSAPVSSPTVPQGQAATELERSGFRPPRHSSYAPQSSRKAPGWVAPTIVGIVVVLLVVVGLLLFLNRGTLLPDFKGWTLNDAQLWADDNKAKLQVDEVYNDEFDAGRVISQNPAPDTKIRSGAFVQVVVSKGHDLTVTLPLPDLMAMTKEQIEAWAAENYMAKVRITTANSDNVSSGRVISFEINDNTVVDEVTRNTPIYITVSKGPVDEQALLITVPNFKEMPLSDSYAFAAENGLTLTVEEVFDTYAPEGTILSQSVKADEKIKKGEEIRLIVSLGQKVVVPDFSDLSKEKAASLAGSLGITVSVNERYSGSSAGRFLSQSLKPDSIYKKGDVLELEYSLGNEVIIADYVGQTKDTLLAWAKELNNQGASIRIRVTYTQSNEPKGRILSQDKSNSLISVNTSIRITVSQGKAVIMPDFVAPKGSGFDEIITREKALEMCEALNIVPIFVEAKKEGRLPGEVWSQSVSAGTEVDEGSTVTLKYVPAGEKISVPNLVGKTESAIRKGTAFQNFEIRFVIGDEYVEGYVGKVYEQSLPAGSKTAIGSKITVYIGPEAAQEPEPTNGAG